MEREIAQIISASTVDDLALLDDTRHNYLAAVFLGGTAKKPCLGLACVDHTTGEFTVAEFSDRQQMEDELARLSPSELLIPDDQARELGDLGGSLPYDSYAFLSDQALHTLRDQFKVQSLDGFGCAGMTSAPLPPAEPFTISPTNSAGIATISKGLRSDTVPTMFSSTQLHS